MKLATDLHKQLSPLYNPKVNDEGKAALKERFAIDLKQWPSVDAFMARVRERPSVKAALSAEGLG